MTPVLGQVPLRDPGSVMQGFARITPTGGWIFTQVMQDGRFGHTHDYHLAHGDLTLTRLTRGGTILSWMYLRGFGHGQAISVQPTSGQPWIWAEAVSHVGPGANPDGFGTQIARFRWQPGTTITPTAAGVHLYDPLPGTFRNSPSITGDLIGVRYTDASGTVRVAVYALASFLAHDYTPVTVLDEPGAPPVVQGWALLPGGGQVALLTGTGYTAANPPPGNTQLTVYDASGVISQTAISDGAGLSWREPEGLQATAGQVCNGFASGPADARRASVYCRPAP